jgi:hypothetical protein
MRKADLIRKNAVESARNERAILALARNAFVVRFHASFASRDNLYIVMEYAPGGDLGSLLRALGALDEAAARRAACSVSVQGGVQYCSAVGRAACSATATHTCSRRTAAAGLHTRSPRGGWVAWHRLHAERCAHPSIIPPILPFCCCPAGSTWPRQR